jgi:hypothetical protein
MQTLDFQMTADGLLAAWRPHSSHVLLETSGAPRLGNRLAARLRLDGAGLGVTVLGRVGSVLRGDAHHRVEFVPDPAGVAAVRLLVAAAQGRSVRFRERPPRLLARLPAVLRSVAAPLYMDTHSVSRDGCRLHWSGPLPDEGQAVALRIGAGPFASNVEGVVRWVASRHQAVAAVGVAFVGGADPIGWLRWLEHVTEAGAPLL